jgi:hypothetical protein
VTDQDLYVLLREPLRGTGNELFARPDHAGEEVRQAALADGGFGLLLVDRDLQLRIQAARP